MLHQLVILLLYSATARLYLGYYVLTYASYFNTGVLTNYCSEANNHSDKNLKIRLYNKQPKEQGIFRLEY